MRFRKVESVLTPHGGQIVWRYMDRERFFELVNRCSLYFPNALQLSDQYEVTIPEGVLRAKRRQLERKGVSGSGLDHALRHFSWAMNPDKKLTWLNCWSMRRQESYALWKVYAGKKANGVAIRSTVGKLKHAIEMAKNDGLSDEFYIGQVQYRDYLPEAEVNRFRLICTKKRYYDFEEEVRVFFMRDSPLPGKSQRVHVRVDLPTLVQRIVISPFSNESDRDSVVRALKKVGLRPSLVSASRIRESETPTLEG